MISEKVTDLNVLCLRVLNWIVGNLDGAFIVAVEWHIFQVDDIISEKVMTNLNVLCLRMLNWVVGNLDGAFIVAVEWNLFQMNAIVYECLLHP